jgi:flagellar motor switch protein FliM
MTAAKTIVNFPMTQLPHVSSLDLKLKKKLHALYSLLENKPDVFADIVAPLSEILRLPVKAKLTHVESLSLDGVIASLPEHFLLNVIRLDPHTKRAFLVFDPVLAQILVNAALSGEKAAFENLSYEQLKPLTPLSEAVVEYAVVCALEKASHNMGKKNFSIAFENIIRDSKKLLGMYAHSDDFAMFSVSLMCHDKEFYVKFALPLSLSETLGAPQSDQAFFKTRLEGFAGFKTEFQLEVGEVELLPEDLNALAPGDIVFFDDCRVAMNDARVLTGQAKLKPVGLENEAGYLVDVEVGEDGIRAKVD